MVLNLTTFHFYIYKGKLFENAAWQKLVDRFMTEAINFFTFDMKMKK